MAKMFYSLEEAADRLGKTEAELRQMAESNQLQEFRDGDKLMFKRDQVDLLADDDHAPADSSSDDDILGLADSTAGDDLGAIGLADSGEIDLGGASATGIGLADSTADTDLGGASAIGLADSAEIDLGGASAIGMADSSLPAEESGGIMDLAGESDAPADTGISIFDADETDDGDPAAQTAMDDAIATPEFAMDSGSSGSGLLDLTQESDDTSLGADLMDDIYSGDTSGETAGETMPAADASALFESAEDEPADDTPVAVAAVEPYDGAGSGLVGGLALGMCIALLAAMGVVVLGWVSASGSTIAGTESLISQVGDQWMPVAGGAAGVVLIFGVVGLVLGKRGG